MDGQFARVANAALKTDGAVKRMGFDSSAVLQMMKKTKEQRAADRETRRAEKLKQRELKKFVRAKTGFSRIGLGNV